MTVDATPPPPPAQPPPPHLPPPELPPGLVAEYLESARSQLGVLAGLAERLVVATSDSEAIDALRRETHKVHGSAGSYGFMEASRLAARMEATVKDWAAGADQVPEVIYVEDDAALAELLEYGLRAHGYRFLAYRNGRDALRELLALDVHGTHPLLLLDVDLPALDGYSILGALDRERPGTYRVVFTTVHGTEEEQLRGLEAGALDYLVKPISLRVALEKIKRWVGGGRGGR